MNVRPLLRLVFQRFLGDFSGFTDMVAQHVPSPLDNAATKVKHIYGGNPDTKRATDMINCDADDGHLMIHSTKQYPTEDATSFHVRLNGFSFFTFITSLHCKKYQQQFSKANIFLYFSSLQQ